MPNLKNKFAAMKELVKQNMQPAEILKMLTPFEIDFKLKIFANRNEHDYVILLGGLEKEGFTINDVQSLINTVLATRGSELRAEAREMRYEGRVYFGLYIDFPKETKETEG